MQNSPEKIEKIRDVVQLYEYAEQQNYDIYWYDFGDHGLECLSVMDPSDQKCYIALDPFQFESQADELCKGLHELGHCDTGSFYNQYAACDVRRKHENQADKRAIRLLLTAQDLDAALLAGYTELWSLAEHFGVTEEFMRKALCWYTHGNLSPELYY